MSHMPRWVSERRQWTKKATLLTTSPSVVFKKSVMSYGVLILLMMFFDWKNTWKYDLNIIIYVKKSNAQFYAISIYVVFGANSTHRCGFCLYLLNHVLHKLRLTTGQWTMSKKSPPIQVDANSSSSSPYGAMYTLSKNSQITIVDANLSST